METALIAFLGFVIGVTAARTNHPIAWGGAAIFAIVVTLVVVLDYTPL